MTQPNVQTTNSMAIVRLAYCASFGVNPAFSSILAEK
jgi:hypothetical protein